MTSIPKTMLLGAITAGITALPMVACRGVGLIDFIPEFIPGALLGEGLGIDSVLFNASIYLATGAFVALIYRQIFKQLRKAGWLRGMVVGAAQWLIVGIAVSLLSPLLPDSPLLLPAESPRESIFGLFCILMIFATHVLFGITLGFMLMEGEEAGIEQPGKIPEAPAAEEIERRKAA